MEFESATKKNLWIFFQKYGFIRKIEPFHLSMKHIKPIFQYIFDSLGFNPMNVNLDFVFQGLNRLWMVSVTLILNGYPQKIVQRAQMTTPSRRIDIRISSDYSIFENGAQKIICYFSYVASGPVLLKSNVVYAILLNFWKQKFVEHGMVALAIDRNSGSLLILPNDATVPKSVPNSHSLWMHRLLNNDILFFWAPNATILLIDLIDLLPK